MKLNLYMALLLFLRPRAALQALRDNANQGV